MKAYIANLETEGYCRIPQIYSREEVKKALDLVLEWQVKTENAQSANVPFLNRNHSLVYNLQNKDFYFLELIFGKEIIQDILLHFLNDKWFKQIPPDHPNYILRSYTARSSNARLPLHIDSFVPYQSAYPFAVQMSIILEDQNQTNGCTVVIPGSHRSGEYVTQDAFADAVPIESLAGDLVIWDSRIWHGTTENKSDGTRWALLATFVRWWIKQAFNITENLPQEIYVKLTDNQKAILGFCSIPYANEFEGIDMKRGYDALPESVQKSSV